MAMHYFGPRMGAAESVPEEPAWKRVPGDKLNKLNLPAVHEFYLPPPVQGGKPTKRSICRCWLSKRFPICDNSHLKLHKQARAFKFQIFHHIKSQNFAFSKNSRLWNALHTRRSRLHC